MTDQVDALGLIGQLLDQMNRGAALPGPDQKVRFIKALTMDEASALGRPEAPRLDARIAHRRSLRLLLRRR
jgi:hypothetical protein